MTDWTARYQSRCSKTDYVLLHPRMNCCDLCVGIRGRQGVYERRFVRKSGKSVIDSVVAISSQLCRRRWSSDCVACAAGDLSWKQSKRKEREMAWEGIWCCLQSMGVKKMLRWGVHELLAASCKWYTIVSKWSRLVTPALFPCLVYRSLDCTFWSLDHLLFHAVICACFDTFGSRKSTRWVFTLFMENVNPLWKLFSASSALFCDFCLLSVPCRRPNYCSGYSSLIITTLLSSWLLSMFIVRLGIELFVSACGLYFRLFPSFHLMHRFSCRSQTNSNASEVRSRWFDSSNLVHLALEPTITGSI